MELVSVVFLINFNGVRYRKGMKRKDIDYRDIVYNLVNYYESKQYEDNEYRDTYYKRYKKWCKYDNEGISREYDEDMF